MPDHRRTIDPTDESGARLRLFMDSETMGDLAASEPDPGIESLKGVDPFEPWRPWAEEDVEGSAAWSAGERGSD